MQVFVALQIVVLIYQQVLQEKLGHNKAEKQGSPFCHNRGTFLPGGTRSEKGGIEMKLALPDEASRSRVTGPSLQR
jgi:hypothetical protein